MICPAGTHEAGETFASVLTKPLKATPGALVNEALNKPPVKEGETNTGGDAGTTNAASATQAELFPPAVRIGPATKRSVAEADMA